jgi:hypothetical protein
MLKQLLQATSVAALLCSGFVFSDEIPTVKKPEEIAAEQPAILADNEEDVVKAPVAEEAPAELAAADEEVTEEAAAEEAKKVVATKTPQLLASCCSQEALDARKKQYQEEQQAKANKDAPASTEQNQPAQTPVVPAPEKLA